MIFIKPLFYDEFKCIGSACTDNCCIGWEIDVDDDTLDKYKKIQGGFGARIEDNLIESSDGTTCFRLCENERCAFLNKDNLCDIIINCGENHLCDICREHPRFYEWFPGVTECGLGLCCEEACRLLLLNGFSLAEYNDGEEIELTEKEDIVQSDTYIFMAAFRERLFDVLSSSKLSLEEKLVKVLQKTEGFTGEKIKLRNDHKLLNLYLKSEPIDNEWTAYIKNLSKEIEKISAYADSDFFEKHNERYSKILSYILYRHMIKAVFDNCVFERVRFCVESLRFIMLCDAKTEMDTDELTLKDCIDNMKRWSKQIEYSEENTELLIFGDETNGEG